MRKSTTGKGKRKYKDSDWNWPGEKGKHGHPQSSLQCQYDWCEKPPMRKRRRHEVNLLNSKEGKDPSILLNCASSQYLYETGCGNFKNSPLYL